MLKNEKGKAKDEIYKIKNNKDKTKHTMRDKHKGGKPQETPLCETHPRERKINKTDYNPLPPLPLGKWAKAVKNKKVKSKKNHIRQKRQEKNRKKYDNSDQHILYTYQGLTP